MPPSPLPSRGGSAIQADAPLARSIGFAPFGRSRWLLWVSLPFLTSQTRDVGHPGVIHRESQDLTGAAAAEAARALAAMAMAMNMLVHSLPLCGEAATRGACRMATQMRNIAASRYPARRARTPLAVASAAARNERP